VNARHPNNASATDFLNRYWSVATSGYTGITATVAATYTDADITGKEANILMGRWAGAIPWTKFASSINTATNTLTASNINSFGDFTGISGINPTVSISFTQGAASVCQNSPVTLQANATGDPTITYLWSPGGATSQTINPPTSTAGTITYTVTVTDGNGFTANTSQSVASIAPALYADAGPSQTVCNNTITTLAAAPPQIGTGLWVFHPGHDSAGGAFGDRTSPTSTFSGQPGRTYTLKFKIMARRTPIT
jgi:hypothetical protein